jgi:hypothetical protein
MPQAFLLSSREEAKKGEREREIERERENK